jgi:hypothetical protein
MTVLRPTPAVPGFGHALTRWCCFADEELRRLAFGFQILWGQTMEAKG